MLDTNREPRRTDECQQQKQALHQTYVSIVLETTKIDADQ